MLIKTKLVLTELLFIISMILGCTFQTNASLTKFPLNNTKLVLANNNYKLNFVSCDSTDYPKVKLFYKIYDKNGNIVNNYKIKKIVIYEKVAGGEYLMREVKNHEVLSNTGGINTSLVIDRSTSLSSNDLKKIKEVLNQYIDNMNFDIGDTAEIISFGSDIKNVVKYTNNIDQFSRGIDQIQSSGRTKLYDALYRGISHAAIQNGARCVIGFTDGLDNESTHSYNDIINHSIEKQVPVYIVGAGNNINTTVLKKIANDTGGKYWNISDLSDFFEKLKDIYAIEKSSYYFEYITDIPKNDKRTIKVILNDGNNIIENETEITPIDNNKLKEEILREDLEDSKKMEMPNLNSWYKTIDDLWYYFETDINNPKKGWFIDPTDDQHYYLDLNTGVMAVGWTNIDGNLFYFNESHENEPNWYSVGNGFYESYGKKVKAYGSMFRNEATPDGRTVDDKGKLITARDEDYVLPNSTKKLLTLSDISGLSKDKLRLAINEIYARHGRKFKKVDIQQYFNSKPWYRGTIEANDFDAEKILSSIEIKNITFLEENQ